MDSDITDQMEKHSIDEPWKQSLKKHHQALRTGIIINNFLPKLNELPLTDTEYSQIHDLKDNMKQVDELIRILKTKTRMHFDRFCSILEQNDYWHWATALREGPQGAPLIGTSPSAGTTAGPPSSAGIPVSPPLSEATPELPQTHATPQTEQSDASDDCTQEIKDIVAAGKQMAEKSKRDCPVLGILVVGETGTGKSTLVNNLLRVETVEVGQSLYSETSEICKQSMVVDGVSIDIYDTPGLGDFRGNRDDVDHDYQYLQAMKTVLEGEKIHLVIYCLKLTETKLRKGIIQTFQEYSKIGVKWEQTVIALTFADCLPVSKKEKDSPGFEIGHFFNGKVAEWCETIRRVLIENVGLAQEEASKVECYPITDNPEALLMNGNEWYVPLWLQAIRLQPPAAAMRFLGIYVPYLESSPAGAPAPYSPSNSDPSTIIVPIDNHGSAGGSHTMSHSCTRQNRQLILNPNQEKMLLDIFIKKIKLYEAVGAATGGAAGLGLGAAVGSFIGGTVGVIGGPVGAVVGIGVGGTIGGSTGIAAGAKLGRWIGKGIGIIKSVYTDTLIKNR